jgi:isopenicillin-N epimerase
MRQHWTLDPNIIFLNHGSFGACPRVVLEAQAALRERMERQPVDFLARDWWGLVDEARVKVAAFVGADPADMVFVRNATEGVNAVLRSFPLQAGDEVLVTDHEYLACRFALDYAAKQAGANVVVAQIPFPGTTQDAVVEAITSKVTDRTRLALLDHVTSQTGLVFPIARLVAALSHKGVAVLVDGAHAPGMVELNLKELGAAFYTANLHKWVCAPKGAGLLVVNKQWQDTVRPLSISHGAGVAFPNRSRFHAEFDWPGTDDFTAWLCAPVAIEAMESFVRGDHAGGWDTIRRRNHALALQARALLCDALQIPPPCPDDMIGSTAALPLPPDAVGAHSALDPEPMNTRLRRAFHIEVPVISWPAPPSRLLRISAQLYNTISDYEQLARALVQSLA